MLSPFQKKMVSCAITCAAIMFLAFFGVSAFVLSAKFLGKFSSVIWPLATAGIISFILKPIVDGISNRFRISPGIATLAIFTLLVILASAVAMLILPFLAEQVMGIIKTLPEIAQRALKYIGEHFPELKSRIVERIGHIIRFHSTGDVCTQTERQNIFVAYHVLLRRHTVVGKEMQVV